MRWAKQMLILLKPNSACLPQSTSSFYPRAELSCSPLHPQSLSQARPEAEDTYTHSSLPCTIPQLWVHNPELHFLLCKLLLQVSLASLPSMSSLEWDPPFSCLSSSQRSEPFPTTQDSNKDNNIQHNIHVKNISLFVKPHRPRAS